MAPRRVRGTAIAAPAGERMTVRGAGNRGCAAIVFTATSTHSVRSATRRIPQRPLAEVPRLSGWLVERDGRDLAGAGCARHGLVRTLYDEFPEILRYLEQWTAPTKVHEPDARATSRRCPLRTPTVCRRCRPSTPASCWRICLITATQAPPCFAESEPALSSVATIEQVLANIDTRLSREQGRLDG